jgi:flagellar protein FlaG
MDVNRTGAGYAAPTSGSGEVAPPPPPMPIPGSSGGAASEFPAGDHVETTETLRRAVGEINASMATHGRHLSIEFHEPTGRRMVTVYDSETNEAIREIPPQRVLDAHANLLELAGLFVDSRG